MMAGAVSNSSVMTNLPALSVDVILALPLPSGASKGLAAGRHHDAVEAGRQLNLRAHGVVAAPGYKERQGAAVGADGEERGGEGEIEVKIIAVQHAVVVNVGGELFQAGVGVETGGQITDRASALGEGGRFPGSSAGALRAATRRSNGFFH